MDELQVPGCRFKVKNTPAVFNFEPATLNLQLISSSFLRRLRGGVFEAFGCEAEDCEGALVLVRDVRGGRERGLEVERAEFAECVFESDAGHVVDGVHREDLVAYLAADCLRAEGGVGQSVDDLHGGPQELRGA